MNVIPIIMSGGAGSRLWPASRALHPKPFLRLPDGGTLLGKTYARALSIAGDGPVLTVTNRDLHFQTSDEYLAVAPNRANIFLLEPFGRDTAAAIAMAALYAADARGPDSILLVLPADHLIDDTDAFHAAIGKAKALASGGRLVAFGIRGDRPETGFGYIEADGETVLRFVEKPPAEKAAAYLATGRFFWNSGMFCFPARVMIDAMHKFCPDILDHARAALAAAGVTTTGSQTVIEIDEASFARVPATSIDYAVMEKIDDIAFVPCEFKWSDIGSWSAMASLMLPDTNGNRISGEVELHNSRECFVQADGRLVGLVGVNGLIVVDTPDALLVTTNDHAQGVKALFDQLKARDHGTHSVHRTVYRPWGSYTVLEEGLGFKIKRIEVKPGGRLSLQSHKHRAEHWVVVSGRAKVTNNDIVQFIEKNQSTFIPLGAKHRVENAEPEKLIMIEVQSGDYLGEDDIVRYEDVYGRV